MAATCPTCGAPAIRRPPYGFIECARPNCIDNPRSEAARIDRRATLDAVGEDTNSREEEGEDDGD